MTLRRGVVNALKTHECILLPTFLQPCISFEHVLCVGLRLYNGQSFVGDMSSRQYVLCAVFILCYVQSPSVLCEVVSVYYVQRSVSVVCSLQPRTPSPRSEPASHRL